MASPTQWTWVWVDSGSWWWTGRPGMLQFIGSQRVGHNWETELTDWQSYFILFPLLLFCFKFHWFMFFIISFLLFNLCFFSSLSLFSNIFYVLHYIFSSASFMVFSFFSLSPFFLIFCSGILDYLRLFFFLFYCKYLMLSNLSALLWLYLINFDILHFHSHFAHCTFFNFHWDFLFDPWII